MKVVLDPGHGMGNRALGVFDSGALGPDGAREADYTLSYCLKMEPQLKALGHDVSLTRRDGMQPCSLLYRIRTARLLGSDAFVSVHFNASTQKTARGFEVLWRTPGSDVFAGKVRDALQAGGNKALGAGIVERPDLAVLCRPNSILIEYGFIDNPDDFELISDTSWEELSCKIASQAIDGHLRT